MFHFPSLPISAKSLLFFYVVNFLFFLFFFFFFFFGQVIQSIIIIPLINCPFCHFMFFTIISKRKSWKSGSFGISNLYCICDSQKIMHQKSGTIFTKPNSIRHRIWSIIMSLVRSNIVTIPSKMILDILCSSMFTLHTSKLGS